MPRVVIAGCGFVGLQAARLFHAAGWSVLGCTHSAESAAALRSEAFPIRPLDITDGSVIAEAGLEPEPDAVVHCASSGRGGVDQYRRVYLEGARNLMDMLSPRIMLFTSSTSVYPQIDGEEVTEESAAEPSRETGCILREAENLVLAGGGTVARLAGIYGPGRSVLLRKFFEGEAVIEGDGGRWINQIHRDDAAAALVVLVQQGRRGIYNVSDDLPISQRALYEWLAARFDRPIPPSGPIDRNRKRGWTHKRVANRKLRALGWKPRYPSFFEAVQYDPGLVAAAQDSAGESPPR
jgi:nucleoside-diphosphate-sugar epimerase